MPALLNQSACKSETGTCMSCMLMSVFGSIIDLSIMGNVLGIYRCTL